MNGRFWATLAGLCAGFVAIHAYRAAEAATVGHWRFEEGAANSAASGNNSVLDSSGHGLHGTPLYGPVYRANAPTTRLAANTRSLEFDGITGQRVVVPDGPLVTLTHSLTLEAFIQARPLKPGTGSVGEIIFRADNRPGFDPYQPGLLQPGNVLQFQITNASNQTAALTATVAYDEWLHVAGTLDDATGTMKLYVNGVIVASTTTTVRPLGALHSGYSPGLSLGNDFTGQYGQCFHGLIDEVRISDVALEPHQFLIKGASFDYDYDGDVDLADYRAFQFCFNGPNSAPGLYCPVNADADGDIDVDLVDFRVFATCFNGPNRPAACGV